MLNRLLFKALVSWQHDNDRKPLMVRGARQVGKSRLITEFGEQCFKNIIVINFENSPEFKNCFNTLKPKEICQAISIISKQTITPGKTLLFFDEIQDCPQAIQSLRYFKEQMPELHVISAGSLLELTLKKANFRMPVGRVQSLFLYPMSFQEYLLAFNPSAANQLTETSLSNPIPAAIHEYLLKELRTFLLLGGMPEAVASYKKNSDIQKVQQIQASIIDTYKQDFGHYSDHSPLPYLEKCFDRIPLMVGQKIKYNKIDAGDRSRNLKQALSTLESASILQRVHATSARGLPLDATLNEKKFKLNFIDVGLVKRFNQLDASLLLQEDVMLLNKGALAEQFVGQELLAHSQNYEKAKLYFWARDGSSKAEVDFVKVIGKYIYPIEVKSGKAGTLRSLKQYLLENNNSFGIRISQQPLSFEKNILSIPLYMLSELDRLVALQANEQR